ncbi:MAG: hypothetical protein E7575_07180 [Ruminococcaceae bacterium]|nr:hypothetical protein [Oscillospiraceae bacterium]
MGDMNLPLLLLDNGSMMSVLNEGEFKCCNLTFDDAKHILKVYESAGILKCFSNPDIEKVMREYLEGGECAYPYKRIRNMRVGQDAIVFKLYVTASESNPVISADDGVWARKIQNVFVYCQYLTRFK